MTPTLEEQAFHTSLKMRCKRELSRRTKKKIRITVGSSIRVMLQELHRSLSSINRTVKRIKYKKIESKISRLHVTSVGMLGELFPYLSLVHPMIRHPTVLCMPAVIGTVKEEVKIEASAASLTDTDAVCSWWSRGPGREFVLKAGHQVALHEETVDKYFIYRPSFGAPVVGLNFMPADTWWFLSNILGSAAARQISEYAGSVVTVKAYAGSSIICLFLILT